MEPSVSQQPHASLDPVLQALFDRLLSLLLGADPELRRGALIALARLQGETAAAVVFERYQSDNLEEYLALAVNRLDPERASKVLISALGDPNPEARLAAAMALSQNKNDASVRVLTDTLDLYFNPGKAEKSADLPLLSEEALINSIRALGDIGQPMCLAQLRKFVLGEANPRVRASAVASLGRHITEAMLPTFQGLLKDQDARVRANAVEAIGNLHTPKVVAVLQSSLYDANQRVRANAIKAIWQYGDYEVTPTIKEMLTHTAKQQRVSGIYAVGEIKAQSFFKSLLPFLKHTDADIRRNTVIALKKFGRNETSMTLNTLLADPDPDVRIQVIYSLIELFAAGALSPLLQHLETEEHPAVLAVLLPQLSRLGGEALLGKMAMFLEHSEERVVIAAIEAITRLKPDNPPVSLLLELQKLLQTAGQRVRTQAIRSLWHWGQNQALSHVLPMLQAESVDTIRRSLALLGDIFNLVSEQHGAEAVLFDRHLREAVEGRRRQMAGEKTHARREQLQETFNQAQADLQNNQIQSAETLFQGILQQDSSHIGALVGLGDLLFRTGRVNEAIQPYERALHLQPNLTKVHYALGQIHHRNGSWALASHALDQTVKLHPKLPQAWLLLAEALEKEGRMDGAITALQQLQNLLPKNPSVLSRLARAFFLTRKIGEGISWARQAAVLGANDPVTALILATGDLLGPQTLDGSRRLLRLLRLFCEAPERISPQELKPLLIIAEEAVSRRTA